MKEVRARLKTETVKLAASLIGEEKDAIRLLAKLITAQEVAELLSIKLATVRALTYRRKIPCVKIGRRGVRYRLLDILTFIEDRSRPTLPE